MSCIHFWGQLFQVSPTMVTFVNGTKLQRSCVRGFWECRQDLSLSTSIWSRITLEDCYGFPQGIEVSMKYHNCLFRTQDHLFEKASVEVGVQLKVEPNSMLDVLDLAGPER